MSIEGTIIAAHGRHYEVETADGHRWQAVPRAKKSVCACGDRVHIEPAGVDQARILDHLPRRSLLYRSDQWKQKLIAANATQIVLVTATEPAFSTELLSRALVAAGVPSLSVATFDEGLELRQAGIAVPILVLFPIPPELVPDAMRQRLSVTAGDQLTLTVGASSIIMKKDGTITIKGKDISIDGAGKITAKAATVMTLKGAQVMVN